MRRFVRAQMIPLLMAVTVCAFVIAIYSLAVAHNAGCERNDVLRGVLDLTRPTPAEIQRMSEARKKRVDRFYTRAFAIIDKGKC